MPTRTYKRKRPTMKRRRYKRRRTAKTGRALTKRIKQVIGREAETRTIGECLISNRETITTDSYNVIFLNDIAQQSTYNSDDRWNFREGQEYFLVGSRIHFNFINYSNGAVAGATRPMMFRVLVVEARDQLNVVVPNSLSQMWINPLSDNESFAAISNKIACMNYKIDSKRFKVHYDKVIKVGHDGNGNGVGIMKKWLPFKTKVKCREELAGETLQNKGFFLIWFAHDPYVVGENPVTSWAYQLIWKTYFKDH